jgi:DNA-binding NtrC family response regulator
MALMRDHEPMQAIGNAALDLPTYLDTCESDCIHLALNDAQWNVAQAAKVLGIGRTTLIEKIRKLDIKKESVPDAWQRLSLETARLQMKLNFLGYFFDRNDKGF